MGKSNSVRMRIEFEHLPLLDISKDVKCAEDLDSMLENAKLKIFGKRKA